MRLLYSESNVKRSDSTPMTSTATTAAQAQKIEIGSAQIHLQNVLLREDILLDEVHLDGGDVRIALPAGNEPARFRTEETRFRAVMSEPNLNRLLAANLPPDVPLRNLRAVLLSGRVRLTAQAKLLGLPLTLEAVPRIDNGVRVFLDWQGANLSGLSVPKALVEVLEQHLNKNLDLTKTPFPIRLEEVRCEPGRLTVIGQARVALPPTKGTPPVAPFSAREMPPASSDTRLPVESAPPTETQTAPTRSDTSALLPDTRP
jgi:hypothetical protein